MTLTVLEINHFFSWSLKFNCFVQQNFPHVFIAIFSSFLNFFDENCRVGIHVIHQALE